jgi:hypothetical protein
VAILNKGRGATCATVSPIGDFREHEMADQNWFACNIPPNTNF